MEQDAIIRPHNGTVHVRTPTPHPLSKNFVYYAESASPDSTGNQMWAMQWERRTIAPATLLEMSTAQSNNVLWPTGNVVDRKTNTLYSSSVFNSQTNSNNTYLAAWLKGGRQYVKSLRLISRMENGVPSGFPATYRVYITSPDNTAWNYLGTANSQPDSKGIATVYFASTYLTYGVLIVPETLGRDALGNYVFQLSEMNLQY